MWLKKYFFLWNIWIMIIKWYFVSDCARKTSRLDRWMILRRLTNRLAFITEIPPSESSSANNHIYLPVEYAIGKPLDSGSTDAVINCISRKRRAIVNRYITRSLNRKLQSIRKVNSIYIAVGQEWVLRHIILNWPISEWLDLIHCAHFIAIHISKCAQLTFNWIPRWSQLALETYVSLSPSPPRAKRSFWPWKLPPDNISHIWH